MTFGIITLFSVSCLCPARVDP